MSLILSLQLSCIHFAFIAAICINTHTTSNLITVFPISLYYIYVTIFPPLVLLFASVQLVMLDCDAFNEDKFSSLTPL